MPTKPTQIFVQFPTFDGQSEEIKSLINFFMEGASVFFHGFYDDPTFSSKMTSYTGEIRFNNRPLYEDSTNHVEYTPYELVIPYQNFFTTDFPSILIQGVAPQADLSSSGLPYVGQSPVVTEGITNYTVASLTSVKTAMNLCMGGYTAENAETNVPTSSFVTTNTISLPVQVIPTINDVPNENVKLKPKQIAKHEANEDSLYIQKVSIEDILDSSGNPIEEGFVYDFQLRTPVFGIKDGRKDPLVTDSVFYKLGIARLDNSVTLEAIVEALKTANLHLKVATPGVDTKYVSFSVVQADPLDPAPDYTLYPSENKIEQHIGKDDVYGIATKAIMALQDGSNNIVALVYMKLYNEDGTVYDDIIDMSDFDLYDSEGTQVSTSLNLSLSDQNIDPVPANNNSEP